VAHIQFLDETLRDGNQSLWGLRMKAGMALPVSPIIDRTGFRVIDLTGSTAFEVLIKYCQEDPWQGLDLLVASMPRTPIRGGMRSNAAVTFATMPDALMDTWMRQLNRHGCRSFWIYDVLYEIDNMDRLAK
jgi:oxaloacetate decarboxylase (Na+ extruding) subunit alpha